MPTYQAPLADMRYLLNDVLEIGRYDNLLGFSEASEEIVDAILEEGAKLTQEVLQPLNQSADEEGCHWTPEGVTTPKGYKEAYKTFVEGGWT